MIPPKRYEIPDGGDVTGVRRAVRLKKASQRAFTNDVTHPQRFTQTHFHCSKTNSVLHIKFVNSYLNFGYKKKAKKEIFATPFELHKSI